MSNSIPKSLQRAGIDGVVDNLPEGGRIVLPEGYIFGFFGERIANEFQRRKKLEADNASTDTTQSVGC